MSSTRYRSAVGLTLLILVTHARAASAHGVEVTAQVEESNATLEFTDETGRVCISVDPELANMAVAAIADDTDEIVLILGENLEPSTRCQFYDVDAVNGVLADVDAHRLIIATGSSEASGQLNKPLPPESETAASIPSNETDEPNVALIFGGGLALGISIAVVRKWLRQRAER